MSPKFNTLKIREVKHITTTKELTTNTTEQHGFIDI